MIQQNIINLKNNKTYFIGKLTNQVIVNSNSILININIIKEKPTMAHQNVRNKYFTEFQSNHKHLRK